MRPRGAFIFRGAHQRPRWRARDELGLKELRAGVDSLKPTAPQGGRAEELFPSLLQFTKAAPPAACLPPPPQPLAHGGSQGQAERTCPRPQRGLLHPHSQAEAMGPVPAGGALSPFLRSMGFGLRTRARGTPHARAPHEKDGVLPEQPRKGLGQQVRSKGDSQFMWRLSSVTAPCGQAAPRGQAPRHVHRPQKARPRQRQPPNSVGPRHGDRTADHQTPGKEGAVCADRPKECGGLPRGRGVAWSCTGDHHSAAPRRLASLPILARSRLRTRLPVLLV